MLNHLKYIIFFLTVSFFVLARAAINDQLISLDLQNVPIQDALHILARFNHMNIVISPAIQGTTSVHLHKIPAKEAFNSLIISEHLTQWQINHVWFVGSWDERMQYQSQQAKMDDLTQTTSPLITRIFKIHYAKAKDIASLIKDHTNSLLSSRGRIRVDLRTNTLCIRDIKDRLQELAWLIQQLDVPVPQVLIEAHLASVDYNYEKNLGIAFSSGTHETTATNNGVITLINGVRLNVQLSALESEGHAELISSPSLLTANQQTASIESGEEIPYQEISKSGATGVSFKKAVLSLKATPEIMPNHQILLELQVNQDKPNGHMVLGVPSISTQQIITQILVKSGQTIVLGGIYETNKAQDSQNIPLLSKIPLVGWLFGQHNVTKGKRELLIFVTPKVI